MIEVEGLTKQFGHGNSATTVLRDVSFRVEPGEIFAVVGPSGAGKSTLANCVNLLERPTNGRIVVNDDDLTQLGKQRLREARRKIGTVFQSSNLLARRTAAENIALPLDFLGVSNRQTRQRVDELLDLVGLGSRAHQYPHQLSGGQRQRVGIARALALRPTVLLSDEATSGLDPETTASIVGLLREVTNEFRVAVVFITHEMDTILKVADSVGHLDGGRLVEQGVLADLLLDPDSLLGRRLQPAPTSGAVDRDHTVMRLTYSTTDVPADWIALLSSEFGITAAIHAASIGHVAGVNVGEVVVAVPHAQRHALVGAVTKFGISATPVSPREGAETDVIETSQAVLA